MNYARFAIRGEIAGPEGPSAPVEVRMVVFDHVQRRRRAWLGLAGWWAAAGMAVFLPLLRVLLVPGLAALGIYSAMRRYRTESVVVEVNGTCPACGAADTLRAAEAWQPPTPLTCRACRTSLVFSGE